MPKANRKLISDFHREFRVDRLCRHVRVSLHARIWQYLQVSPRSWNRTCLSTRLAGHLPKRLRVLQRAPLQRPFAELSILAAWCPLPALSNLPFGHSCARSAWFPSPVRCGRPIFVRPRLVIAVISGVALAFLVGRCAFQLIVRHVELIAIQIIIVVKLFPRQAVQFTAHAKKAAHLTLDIAGLPAALFDRYVRQYQSSRHRTHKPPFLRPGRCQSDRCLFHFRATS